MAQRFKFDILTGDDCQAKYDAIPTKDAFTFYLLQSGIGYLGTVKLFDATQDAVTLLNVVTEQREASEGVEAYTPSTTQGVTEKAIIDYVTSKISAGGIISGKFFRAVKSHTITQADLDNVNVSKPEGTIVGDVGLLFTVDNNNTDDGDESFCFISLKDYLSSVYTFKNSNSITITTSESNEISADVKLSTGETNLVINETGLHLNTSSTINATGTGIPTEKAVADYVTQQTAGKVDYSIDGVSNSNDGNIPSTVNAFNYSTEETRIGAWIDGSPLYQIVFTDMFNVTSTTITNASVGFSFPELNIEAIVKVDALMYNTKAVSRGIRIFPYYNTSSYGIIGSGSRSSPNAINVTIYSTSTDENGDVKPILSNISNINDNKVIVIMQYIKKIADN